MSQLSTYMTEPVQELEYAAPQRAVWVEPPQRSWLQPILLLLPLALATVGYIGLAASLVDLAFLTLTALCTLFVVYELYRFSDRFGIGGLVLYGGVLIWFCYDYLRHWSLMWLSGWGASPFTVDTVAKSAACHMLLILCMAIGLRFRGGRWIYRLTARMPEPNQPQAWLWVIILTQVIGLMPYFVFTREPFYLAFYHQITAGRSGIGVAWAVGRTGNANYSWGGYVAQILEVGSGGAILACLYAVFLARSLPARIFCWLVWGLWMAFAFGTGTRGDVIYYGLPMAAFLFIRYNARANELMHRFSFRAYAWAAFVLLLMFILVQIQSRFRGEGFKDVNLSSIDYTQLEGNAMFSEGLKGFSKIPNEHPYFYDNYPGETMVAPIPVYFYWMAVAPMPRAVWNNKPIDPVDPWYNAVALGESGQWGGNVEGTTITKGLAAAWFFRYGVPGLIEGGLLFGWMIGLSERILWNSQGKVLPFLFGLGMATWLFRSYRDIIYSEFYVMAIGVFAIAVLVLMFRPLFGGRRELAA